MTIIVEGQPITLDVGSRLYVIFPDDGRVCLKNEGQAQLDFECFSAERSRLNALTPYDDVKAQATRGLKIKVEEGK